MQPQQQVSQQQQLRKTVLGKSTNVTNVAAAKKLTKRAVFCVDNVKPTCSVDDIIGLVNAWSIATISCFAVKTRRRRSEEVAPTDRKAFRLCIVDEDKEKLLNPAIWPDSVTVSHWYFKPPETPSAAPNENDIGSDNEQVKQRRMEETQTVAADDVTVTTALYTLGVDNTTLYDHGDQ